MLRLAPWEDVKERLSDGKVEENSAKKAVEAEHSEKCRALRKVEGNYAKEK